MTPSNVVTLSGTIIDDVRPGKGRAALFRVEHRQGFRAQDGSVQVAGFAVWCRCWGHGATSVLKYGQAGLDVAVAGRLGYLSEVNAIGIIADSIAYPRPSQLMESEKSASV